MAEINAECSVEEKFEIGLEGVVECIKLKINRKGSSEIVLLLAFPIPP